MKTSIRPLLRTPLLARKGPVFSSTERQYSNTNLNEKFNYAEYEEKNKQTSLLKKTFIYSLISGGLIGLINVYGTPKDTDPEESKSESSFFSKVKRIWNRMDQAVQKYCEPSFDVLLPPPYNGPEAKPYTLVIDLDRFLVCHMWDPVMGKWRVAKRPNVDMFLFYLAHMYEVVVYSSMSQMEAEPLMEKLDPYQMVSYRLYRFATKYENGVYKKDLSRLNRDMSKVLVLGHDSSFEACPENFIKVGPWDGNAQDTLLEDSLSFLESLAFSGIPDLRTVVKSYEGRPILETFDNRQRATYEAMRQQRVQANNNFVLRALTGLFLPDLSKENAPEMDMLPYEERKIAISAQRQAEYTKEMARLKVEFEKQIEANKAYLSSHKMPLYDLFTKGPPPPPPELFQGAPTSPTN